MEIARLKGERRTALGRNQVTQLRKQGWLPAVIYGGGEGPLPISISEWELEQHVKHHQKVFQLEVDGRKQDAYLQEVQWSAIEDHPLHVDFKRIDLSKPIELDVEATFLGHPVGLSKGGVLIKDHPSFKIRCLPSAIPESLPVNIAGLEIDDSLTAKEIPLPAGVELAVPPDLVICHVTKLVVQQVEAPAPAPAAEGTPAEGAGPGAAPPPPAPKA